MKSDLENRGFTNIYVMPNCKDLKILSVDELIYSNNEPYKLCTFSRVMKEKGIEDAIYVVKSINEKLGRVAYVLDIYGQVDKEYEECFKKLCNGFPPYIKYGGLIQFDKSVEVLKNYFLLLFPTHFTTEGIPGTIIDAYFAGLPIICAKWNNYHEIIDDGKTGIGYEIKNNTEFDINIREIFI
jgi:glycosyltransferase involved in cell wall biosynthesis